MKRMLCLAVFVSCFSIFVSVAAEADEVAAKPQLQLTIGHMFDISEDVNGFTNGIFLYDLVNDYPVAFGYAGPVIEVEELNVYALMVLMAEPIGTSIGPSLWLEYKGLFLEYDHYETWLAASHEEGAEAPPSSYYGLAEYSHAITDDISVGVAYEDIGYYQDDDSFQRAYGCFVQFGDFKTLVAYDETPLVPGNEYIIFRFKYGI